MNLRIAHLAPIAAALLAMTSASPAAAQGELERMTWLVPEDANVLGLVRAQQFFNSPIALRNGWDQNRHAPDGPMSHINPDAEYVVFASRSDYVGGFRSNWDLALVTLKAPVEPQMIADAEGGVLDKSDAIPVIWSPRGYFYVPFRPELIGIYSPENRQAVLRWANAVKNRSERTVSPYLSSAVKDFQGDEAQFVVAFDLGSLAAPEQLRAYVARFASVDIKIDDIDAIAATLASVRGATIKIKADTEFYGWLEVDFDKSTAPIKRIAQPLLKEILELAGADVENLRSWRILVEDRRVTFRGPVTNEMALRIGSLISLPTNAADGTPAIARAAPAEAPASNPEGGQEISPGMIYPVDTMATRQYVNSLETILADVADKAVDQRRVNLWCSRYADKINHMPILGIDPDALEYGKKLAITFRNLANRSLGSSLNVNMRRTTEASSTAYAGFYGYGYGAVAVVGQGTDRASMNRIQRQEVTAAVGDEAQVWTEIKNQLAELRRTLTQRHGVEF